jgi:hypothetical protein
VKVHPKDFHIDDLVWKVILPIGWEGPFRVARIVFGNAHLVETMKGVLFSWDLIRPFCITILYHNLLLFIDIFHI